MKINELLVAIQKEVRDRDDKIIELREIIRKLESKASVKHVD